MDSSGHLPVLLDEVLNLFQPKPGMVYLDCTVGRGGHAAALAPLLAPGGRIIGLDVDQGNLDYARQRLGDAPVPVDLVRANFAEAPTILQNMGIEGADLLLADLGFSSTQMDDPERGFSFNVEAPLDMRLDDRLTVTAADLVNDLPERELADLIFQFGEERLSRVIARKIVADRQRGPILTTSTLADLVRGAYGYVARKRGGARRAAGRHQGRSRIDPATRTFMALRIAVNQELAALERLLEALPKMLRPQAVAAIISFHSLEDRRVKQAFLKLQQDGLAQRLTTKPMVADEAETMRNPRSRSAKMRAIRLAPKRYTGDTG